MRNILITGAAGFVGQSLVKSLSRNTEHKLFCLDRDEGRLEKLVDKSNIVRVHMDLLDTSSFYWWFKETKPTIVVHLAANSDIKFGSEDCGPDFRDTLQTSIAIAEACRNYGVRQIVFSSTSAVYGETNAAIDRQANIPRSPVSNYGWAKLASELLLKSVASEMKIPLGILRFPNVVGPNPTHGILYDFKLRLKENSKKLNVLGDGNQRKPYMHLDDLVPIIEYVLNMSQDRDFEANVGPSDTITVREIVDIVEKIVGGIPKIEFGASKGGWEGDVPSYSYVKEPAIPSNQFNVRPSKLAIEDAFNEWWKS